MSAAFVLFRPAGISTRRVLEKKHTLPTDRWEKQLLPKLIFLSDRGQTAYLACRTAPTPPGFASLPCTVVFRRCSAPDHQKPSVRLSIAPLKGLAFGLGLIPLKPRRPRLDLFLADGC